jgi:hypothetical protein
VISAGNREIRCFRKSLPTYSVGLWRKAVVSDCRSVKYEWGCGTFGEILMTCDSASLILDGKRRRWSGIVSIASLNFIVQVLRSEIACETHEHARGEFYRYSDSRAAAFLIV